MGLDTDYDHSRKILKNDYYNTYPIHLLGKGLTIEIDEDDFKGYDTFLQLLNEKKRKEMKEYFEKLNWIKENPMKQLTGSFKPETIEDLAKWYRKSDVYDIGLVEYKSIFEESRERDWSSSETRRRREPQEHRRVPLNENEEEIDLT